MNKSLRIAMQLCFAPLILASVSVTAHAVPSVPVTTTVEAPQAAYTQAQFDQSIIVNGATLSFTIPGWYQVQNAETFEEECNGTGNCTVSCDGDFIVINHTIGMRAIVSVVDGFPSSPVITPVSSVIEVNGSTISWPDNGWYMVQSATDLSTQCEGGRSCDVAPGLYHVMNLTTQERFENIEVLPEQVTPVVTAPPVVELPPIEGPILDAGEVLNNGNYRALISAAFQGFSGQLYNDRLLQFPYVTNDNSQSCTLGSYNQSVRALDNGSSVYEFTASICRIVLPELGNGDSLNGSIRITSSPTSHTITSEGFRVNENELGTITFRGQISTSIENAGQTIETVGFGYNLRADDFIQVAAATTRLFRPFSLTSQIGRIEGGYTMTDDRLSDRAIGVRILEPFEYNRDDVVLQGIDPDVFQSVEVRNSIRFARGILRIQADGDSSLILLDASTGDINTVQVTISNSVGSVQRIESWDQWMDDLVGQVTSLSNVR